MCLATSGPFRVSRHRPHVILTTRFERLSHHSVFTRERGQEANTHTQTSEGVGVVQALGLRLEGAGVGVGGLGFGG